MFLSHKNNAELKSLLRGEFINLGTDPSNCHWNQAQCLAINYDWQTFLYMLWLFCGSKVATFHQPRAARPLICRCRSRWSLIRNSGENTILILRDWIPCPRTMFLVKPCFVEMILLQCCMLVNRLLKLFFHIIPNFTRTFP